MGRTCPVAASACALRTSVCFPLPALTRPAPHLSLLPRAEKEERKRKREEERKRLEEEAEKKAAAVAVTAAEEGAEGAEAGGAGEAAKQGSGAAPMEVDARVRAAPSTQARCAALCCWRHHIHPPASLHAPPASCPQDEPSFQLPERLREYGGPAG